MSEVTVQDWDTTRLGDVARVQGGFAFRSGDFADDGVPIVRMSDLKEGHLDLTQAARVPAKIVRSLSEFRLSDGDLLLGMSGSLTNYAIVRTNDLPAYLNQRVGRLILAASDRCDYGFLTLIAISPAYAHHVDTEAAGAAQRNISGKQIERFVLSLPPLPQQRKIARILTTVDNLIEKTEALIAKYQAIKQGMMHDLFTRGVDEHGHLRPPYEQAPELYKQSELGWIPKEWDCLSFGTFIVAGPQNGLYKPISSYSVDGSPIVRIDGFYDGQLCDTKSFRRLHLTRAELAVYILEADDILVNRVNSIDYVGKSAIVPELREATVYESNIMRLKVNRERLLPDFAIRLLCHYTVQHQFRQSAKSAVAQASINQSDIRRCVVAIPRLKEQVCLVERCRLFDRQVDCEKNYLEKLRLQKTGLMQDLLTGKVRVKVDETEETGHV
jgi:type I restriction enzyme S subunit